MKKIKGFSLVELIVTITIVAILATLAYIYFDGNVGNSRDSKRITDLSEMEKVFEVYQTKKGFFPSPTGGVDMTFSGSLVAWTQGTFGVDTNREIKVFGSEYPLDPLFENEYTYSTSNGGREFQLAALREGFEEEEGLGQEVANVLFPNKVHAGKIETAYVVGNYNGFMVRTEDTVGNEFFIASPSIITRDISDLDIVSTIENRKLVYTNFFNIPHSYEGNLPLDGGFNFNVSDPVIFSGSTEELKIEQNLLDFSAKLKYIYATTPTESFDKYIAVLEEDGLTSLKKFLTQTFKIPFRSYFNCKDIIDDNASDGDGVYMIDSDGDGGQDPYEVYCDMNTDGGGWTRVGDNHLGNGNFAGGLGITDAIENDSTTNEIVPLTTPVDGNSFALHQTGNYSSNYQVQFDDPTLLKQGYEIRLTAWRSDTSSGSTNTGTTNTVIMSGKTNPWAPGTCTTRLTYFPYCFFANFNAKMANPQNFGPGGNLTDINISLTPQTNVVTTSYLNGGVLFDGYIPSEDPQYRAGTWIYPYASAEITAIDEWVQAGGFLLSTNDISDWDPLGEYYGVQSGDNHANVSKFWEVANIDHPLVNGSIGLGRDLRGERLIGDDAYSGIISPPLAGDIVLARDQSAPYLPTAILRKHGKGHILFASDEGIFRNMSSGNLFEVNDNEDAFAAAIMAYAIETAAGINPKEGYVFHNRIHYNDGTFSTNGQDEALETITVDGRVWTREQVRSRIYKVPESFDWYVGLDANNNKDLYFTGLKLELFYR